MQPSVRGSSAHDVWLMWLAWGQHAALGKNAIPPPMDESTRGGILVQRLNLALNSSPQRQRRRTILRVCVNEVPFSV
jgi:hypothetical protein